jgi:transposase
MARPSKLDDLMAQRVVDAVKRGLPRRETALMCGIGESTLYDWMRDNPELASRIKRAETEGELELIETIKSASERQWQAAAWLLERRYPERYGRRDGERPLSEQEAEAMVAEAAKLVKTG